MSDLANIINVNENEFEAKLQEFKDKKIIVDFWAAWCGPCVALAPILEDVAKNNLEELVIFKVDVDQNQNLAAKFKVLSIPTLYFFKEGKAVDSVVGVKQKSFLQDKLATL